MNDCDLDLDLGMLCSFCDYHSYQLPEVEGITASQRQIIEDLCKICLQTCKPMVVNGWPAVTNHHIS